MSDRDTPLNLEAMVAADPAWQALTIVEKVETLEAAWAAWVELRVQRAEFIRRSDDARRRLEDQASLMINAAKLALPTSDAPALATAALGDTQRQLDAARAALTAERDSTVAKYAQVDRHIRDVILERVARHATLRPPVARLMVRSLGAERRILHLERPRGDDPVLLLWAMSQRIPTHFDFLFDDSTEDARAEPPTLYAEEGLPELRPPAEAFRTALEPLTSVWPVKGMLIQWSEKATWRWRSRGAVLEAELAEGAQWRNVLTVAEAEAVTSSLVALKLSARLGLELSLG